ncbi:MAG: hypothetical protein ACYC61_09885 [Isosphaeraceae bacterium]
MLLGCSSSGKTIDTASLGPATAILVYDNGRVVAERAIAPGSDEDRAVQDWLRAHPDGWRSDRTTYAPQRYVKGPRFTLNFQHDRCILNCQTAKNGRWIQVSRPLRRDEAVPSIFTKPH